MSYSSNKLHFYSGKFKSHNITISGSSTGFYIDSTSPIALPNGINLNSETGAIYGESNNVGIYDGIRIRGYTIEKMYFTEIEISIYIERIKSIISSEAKCSSSNSTDGKYQFGETNEGKIAQAKCFPETSGIVNRLCISTDGEPIWDSTYIEYCGKTQEIKIAPINISYANLKFYIGFSDTYLPEYYGHATRFGLSVDSVLPKGINFNTTTGMLYGIPDNQLSGEEIKKFLLKVNGYNSEYYNQIKAELEIIRKIYSKIKI